MMVVDGCVLGDESSLPPIRIWFFSSWNSLMGSGKLLAVVLESSFGDIGPEDKMGWVGLYDVQKSLRLRRLTHSMTITRDFGELAFAGVMCPWDVLGFPLAKLAISSVCYFTQDSSG